MSESEPAGPEALVEQLLHGDAPRHLRAAAARGALPLPRSALVRLFVALREDEDEEVRFNAEANLKALEASALHEILGDETCAPEVLAFFATRASRDDKIAERIAFHRAAPIAAIELLAGCGNAAVIELVLTNQERLLAQPGLLDRLSSNPALRADQRGRILELLDRATRDRPLASDQGEGSPDGVSAEIAEAARLLQVDVGELFAASEIIDGEEFERAEDPVIRDAYRKILLLNTAQKAILAMRGGREERMILIRDSNRLVSLAVLRNPRIAEDDVESFARMRSVDAELLRLIGRNRDWLKSHAVITALVNNPKTPQGISTNLVLRLHNEELKRLSRNHDVPELIRRMAHRTLDARTTPHNALKKKKH